ncbi:MAG: nuclear transport factor 2 family protein [Armatimonas sp.]
MSSYTQFIQDYLAALESAATGEALSRFFTSDAEQIEFPNRLNPNGGQSDLSRLLQRAELVPTLLQSQHYEVHTILVQGDTVAVEATWTGVLAVPLGTLAAGSTMTAQFAMFFEFREGRIYRQRNYDCFEPW